MGEMTHTGAVSQFPELSWKELGIGMHSVHDSVCEEEEYNSVRGVPPTSTYRC